MDCDYDLDFGLARDLSHRLFSSEVGHDDSLYFVPHAQEVDSNHKLWPSEAGHDDLVSFAAQLHFPLHYQETDCYWEDILSVAEVVHDLASLLV
jgi:hypothetical protein